MIEESQIGNRLEKCFGMYRAWSLGRIASQFVSLGVASTDPCKADSISL